jgi:hypothetical protein
MQDFIDNVMPLEIQITLFVDDLAWFFDSKEDLEYGMMIVCDFNKIAGIRANPSKSVYCQINCSTPTAVVIDNVTIEPANKRTRQRLLGSFFLPAQGIGDSS